MARDQLLQTRHGGAHARQALSKVPEVTVLFWVIKVLTTGMGETTSDYFANTFNPYLVVPVAGLVFAAALAVQLFAKRYNAAIYWFAVVMVSVFGTMVADVPHKQFGIPFSVTTTVFCVVLAAVLGLWYRSEKTLSIHSITTRRRELFYWATVLTTFALGTATGDLTAQTLGWGYFSSGVLFAVVIAIPTIGHWKFGLNPIFAFWFAYIITRPLGASFADWMGVAKSHGGLEWGTGPVSLVLGVLIVAFVGYLGVTRKDIAD
ncbi:putative membrane-anchored protein [Streptacidiphilus sp. MAP12-33]|uniref:COG4705 family protein n=1 Tax=Streptacidiphilus sp. MAP12-33 TaxID=3156266 RepID=UPI0035146C8D